MSYLITARKWRPKDFQSVIGQVHVTQSLQNAILRNRVGQSYLFSGPRGVGKTTLARVLVKALNCQKGPTTDPCNQCSFCEDINLNSSLDYTEIDGASNRGIDQVRELNDSLKYASPHNKHRIFVIDEVHMLTTEAFNALLKSLEEPPLKIIFIFCTTEAHKVPATIRSRCQHFRFKAFSISTIQLQLETILKKEEIEFEPSALFYIAKAASGSMRDSQSILDQILAYADNQVTQKSVLEVLGLETYEVYLHFLQNLAEQKLAENLKLMNTLLQEGRGVKPFLYSLLDRIHALQFIRVGAGEAEGLGLIKEEYEKLQALSDSFMLRELHLISDLLFEFLKELRVTTEEKTTVDLFLLKLHRYKNIITPEELKAELDALVKANGGGQTAPQKTTQQESLPREFSQPPHLQKLDFSALEKKKIKLDKETFFRLIHEAEEQALSEEIKKSIEQAISFIGFDQPALTLQLNKQISAEEIKKLRQSIEHCVNKKLNAKVKVNILTAEVKSTKEIHNVLKAFEGKILSENEYT